MNNYSQTAKFHSLEQVLDLARKMVAQHLDPVIHGLYSVRINTRLQKVLGRCRFGRRVIEISAEHIRKDSQWRVVDTILHEIAHVIAGYDAGHGPAWQRACRQVGATPTECSESDVKPKWQLAFVRKGVVSVHVERFNCFAYRRTNLEQRYIRNRKAETLGKLVWVPNE